MDLVRARIKRELPQVAAYFQTGGLVDAILNLGMPAPLDIQVTGNDMENHAQNRCGNRAKSQSAARRQRRAGAAGCGLSGAKVGH